MHKIITDGKCKTLFLIFIAKAFVIRVDNEPFMTHTHTHTHTHIYICPVRVPGVTRIGPQQR